MTSVENTIREQNRAEHWENVYANNLLKNVGWYQAIPKLSLELIEKASKRKDSALLDVGGGDGFLIDHLLELEYSDLSVLDISAKALQRAQKRLGTNAQMVNWIHSDITKFKPTRSYDIWHDRACFHFLTDPEDRASYLQTLNRSLKIGATFILGGFSKSGPNRCSGLDVRKYNKKSIRGILGKSFQLTEYLTLDHKTPSGNTQNYMYACFKKVSQ